MRCEIVAVGTELLLGQIVDTNSSWIGERLARLRLRRPATGRPAGGQGGEEPGAYGDQEHIAIKLRRRN